MPEHIQVGSAMEDDLLVPGLLAAQQPGGLKVAGQRVSVTWQKDSGL
jgi:hypothetical protein